jgi:PadR family transcriptional regulator PadR
MEKFKRSYLAVIILQLLQREPMYGYQICKVAKERSKGRLEIQEGTLYPLLRGLEEHQFIKGYWQESPHGPKRKYYELTSEGRKVLETEKQVRQAVTGLTCSFGE